MIKNLSLIFCAIMVISTGVYAQIVVDQSGSGNATTIQAGIDLAPDGGFVTINGGIYLETDITIDGKDITIWFGDDIPIVRSPSAGTGTGMIFRNVTSGAWLYAIKFEAFDTAILVDDCSPDINYCTITDCTTGISVSGNQAGADLAYNLIENFTTAVEVLGGTAIQIRNHTLAEGTTGISVSGGVVSVDRNIIYRCITGTECLGGTVTFFCNDFSENTSDYSGCSQGAEDFFQPPRFCYEAGASPGPYWLHEDSPCWAANNSCGVNLGAFTATYGCTGVAAKETSWGEIKQLYME